MLGSAMKRNCCYCSPEDFLSLRDAHQRMPVPIIGGYCTQFHVSPCAIRQHGAGVRSRLTIFVNEELKTGYPVRVQTNYRVMAQDLKKGMQSKSLSEGKTK